MSHRDDMQRRVDAVIEQHVIAPMNELLIALSDDVQLSREERYDLQQQLRTAIAHHGRQHKKIASARRRNPWQSSPAAAPFYKL